MAIEVKSNNTNKNLSEAFETKVNTDEITNLKKTIGSTVTQNNTGNDKGYRVLLSASDNSNTETAGVYKNEYLQYNPYYKDLYAYGFRREDITNQTIDLDTLNLSTSRPNIRYFICKTDGGTNNISNRPANNAFILDVELIRYGSNTDYITRQTAFVGFSKQRLVRFCANGTWSAWKQDNVEYSAGNQLSLSGSTFSLTSTCTTVSDWNNALTNGWYMGNAATNSPTAAWYMGQVIAHNTNYVLQILYQFTASSDTRYINKYMRARLNGVWGSWQNVTVSKAVPTNAVFTDTNTDTNTWRPVQNNLTSDSTTDSLSAYQGKVLKSAVDSKLPLSGGDFNRTINLW